MTNEIRDIDSFGAKGDCIYDLSYRYLSGADDTAALQAAFDWQQAEKGRMLVGRPGAVYQLRGQISGQSDVLVDWRGAEVFKTTSGTAFRFIAPVEFSRLTRPPEGGVLSVEGFSQKPRPGDAIMILSDAIDPYNRDEGDRASQYRVAEWAIIGEGATAQQIPLPFGLERFTGVDPNDPRLAIGREDERLIPPYATELAARAVLVRRKEADWRNLVLRFEEGHGAEADKPWNGAGLSLGGYTGAVRGMKQIRGYGPSLQVGGCLNLLIETCSAADLENNTKGRQFGYGVADASFRTRVVDCEWRNCRHGFTTNQLKLKAGDETTTALAAAGSQGASVENCRGIDFPDNAPFDTHHGAWNTTFHNCRALRCETGFTVRGRGVQIVDPHIRDTELGFFVFTGYASGSGPADDFFLAAAGPKFRTECDIRGGDIEVSGSILKRQYSHTLMAAVDRMASPEPRMVHGPGIVAFGGRNNSKEVGGGQKAFVENSPVKGKGAQYVRESQFIIRPGGSVDADYSNAIIR